MCDVLSAAGMDILRSGTADASTIGTFYDNLRTDLTTVVGAGNAIIGHAIGPGGNWNTTDDAETEALQGTIRFLREIVRRARKDEGSATNPSPDSHDLRLAYLGFERWNLYIALPLSAWCGPFARLWRLRKRVRVGLVVPCLFSEP